MPKFGGPCRKKKNDVCKENACYQKHNPLILSFSLILDHHDLDTLNHLNWLNDQISLMI